MKKSSIEARKDSTNLVANSESPDSDEGLKNDADSLVIKDLDDEVLASPRVSRRLVKPLALSSPRANRKATSTTVII